MPIWRAVAYTVAFGALNFNMTTCRSNADGASSQAPAQHPQVVELKGVDISQLTDREKREWSHHVQELLAPCPDQPVSLAQCVKEARPCQTCLPSAKYLVGQVRQGKTREQAEEAFRQRFSPDKVRNIEIGDAPVLGPPGAPIEVIEFADFECPFCAAATPLIDALVERYPGMVKVAFKHFPLPVHQNAKGAALAAVAAHKQGKFWEMQHLLFKNQEALREEDLIRYAKQLGLDVKQFTEDRKSLAAEKVVMGDQRLGNKLGLMGTPTVYINGREFSSGSFKDFQRDLDEWIQLEIKLTTGQTMTPKSVDAEPASGEALPVKSQVEQVPGKAGADEPEVPKVVPDPAKKQPTSKSAPSATPPTKAAPKAGAGAPSTGPKAPQE